MPTTNNVVKSATKNNGSVKWSKISLKNSNPASAVVGSAITAPAGSFKKWMKEKKSEVPTHAASGLANRSQRPNSKPRKSHSSSNEAPAAAPATFPASAFQAIGWGFKTYAPNIASSIPVAHKIPPATTHPTAICTQADVQDGRVPGSLIPPAVTQTPRTRQNKNGSKTTAAITNARLK